IEPSNLGILGQDTAAPEEDPAKDPFNKTPPKKKAEEPASGVKALLGAVVKVTVEEEKDFVPLGKALGEYGLADAKSAYMSIVVTTPGEGKDATKDTLLIGKQVEGRQNPGYRYARLASDDGVFMLSDKTLGPIDTALNDPGKLRSLDVAVAAKD